MVWEKPGFAIQKYFSIQHTGNGKLYMGAVILHQLPSVTPVIVLRSFEDLYVIKKDTYWFDSLGSYHSLKTYDTLANGVAPFTVSLSSGLREYSLGQVLRANLFFSKSSNIDPFDTSTFDLTSSSSLPTPADSIGYPINVYRSILMDYHYKSGDRVYVVATINLVELGYQDYGYDDPELNKRIFTGTGLQHSEVKSFIIP